jgi:hypothetical protein
MLVSRVRMRRGTVCLKKPVLVNLQAGLTHLCSLSLSHEREKAGWGCSVVYKDPVRGRALYAHKQKGLRAMQAIPSSYRGEY